MFFAAKNSFWMFSHSIIIAPLRIVSSLQFTISNIVLISSQKKMPWIDARPVIAFVKRAWFFLWYFPDV